MSIVKSLAVGNGDMFYIRHDADSFSVIDCSIPSDRQDEILNEIAMKKFGAGIDRFVSTHPDQDHISGLVSFDDRIGISNFYAVENKAQKSDESDDFKRYKALRDSDEAYYIERGCRRKWLNQADASRGSAGIEIQWPVLTNEHFQEALEDANNGSSPNNISPILRYCEGGKASAIWMGDLESDFMEKIKDEISLGSTDILFAPHHGRKSGRVPKSWLDELEPTIIVVGEAPSSDLTYYEGWDTITQNSAGDIVFENLVGKTHVFVSESSYSVDFLDREPGVTDKHDCHYIGTIYT